MKHLYGDDQITYVTIEQAQEAVAIVRGIVDIIEDAPWSTNIEPEYLKRMYSLYNEIDENPDNQITVDLP